MIVSRSAARDRSSDPVRGSSAIDRVERENWSMYCRPTRNRRASTGPHHARMTTRADSLIFSRSDPVWIGSVGKDYCLPKKQPC